MITNQKLNIYEQYDSSINLWVRIGSEAEHSLLSDKDWHLINSYTDTINLANKGLLADSYLEQHGANMLADCESIEVVTRMKKISCALEYRRKKGIVKQLIYWLFNLKN